MVVRAVGLEPTRVLAHQILNLARLPKFRHARLIDMCAGGGDRTLKSVSSTGFKPAASANSATPARC